MVAIAVALQVEPPAGRCTGGKVYTVATMAFIRPVQAAARSGNAVRNRRLPGYPGGAWCEPEPIVEGCAMEVRYGGRSAGWVLLGMFAACGGGAGDSATAAIRIGYVNAYSGVYEDDLRPTTQGVELAVALVNDSGGVLGRQLELVAEDSASLEENTLAGVERLLDAGVDIVYVGQVLSAEPVQAVLSRGGLLVTPSAPPHLASIPNGKQLFQVAVTRAHLALDPLLQSVRDRGAVFRVLANSASASAATCGFAAARGVDCAWQAFEGATEDWEEYDFRPLLEQLVASRSGPWVLFLMGGTAAGAKALLQLADLVPPEELPFVHTGPNTTGREGYLLSVPPVFFPRTYSTFGAAILSHPTARPFVQLFEQTYGVPPEFGGQTAFEHMVVLALAMEAAGSAEPVEVAAQMRALTTGGTPVGMLDLARVRQLLAAGEDIDLVGFTHPFDLDPQGWMGTVVTGNWSVVQEPGGDPAWRSVPDAICTDIELSGAVSCYPYAQFGLP